MHAGFQLLKMALHAEARLLHEVGGEKAVDRRHHPWMLLGIAITQPQFGNLVLGVHRGTVSILTLRVRERYVYGGAGRRARASAAASTRLTMARTTYNGVPVPAFMYGTAWKKEATTGHVLQAVAAGFTGIDTANQLIHYDEARVGDALLRLSQQGTTREQ